MTPEEIGLIQERNKNAEVARELELRHGKTYGLGTGDISDLQAGELHDHLQGKLRQIK